MVAEVAVFIFEKYGPACIFLAKENSFILIL